MARKKKPKAAPKPVAPEFTISLAGTDETCFRDVFDLLLAEHAEIGYVPLNATKTAEGAYRTLAAGMTLVAHDRDGKAIGTLGLIELGYWYSDATFLQDTWFYVRPEHRNGKVGVALLRAARDLADKRNTLLFVTIANPARRLKKTPMTLVSQEAGYVPFRYTLRVS